MSESNGEMRFDDLEPIKIPVFIGTKEYVLREASADAAVKYRNAGTKAARMQDGKLVGLDGVADVVLLLVCGCLFEVKEIGGNRVEGPVSPVWLRTLPYRIVKPLFDRAKAISKGLEDEDTVETLDAQIKDLTERRDKLAALSDDEKEVAEGGVGKGSRTSTTGTSE